MNPMDTGKMASILESILFVSGDPVSVDRLAHALDVSEEEVGKAIDVLQASYERDDRGLVLVGRDGGVLLATRPEYANILERFVASEREGALSRAALETLSIVAYRGPIGRADIEAIRGVNSTITLRNLLLRGLVERSGNPDDARGFLYSTSFSFLETLGLRENAELPEYEILSKDERLSPAVSENSEKIL